MWPTSWVVKFIFVGSPMYSLGGPEFERKNVLPSTLRFGAPETPGSTIYFQSGVMMFRKSYFEKSMSASAAFTVSLIIF